MMSREDQLWKIITPHINDEFFFHSRAHLLRSFTDPKRRCFVKRDDELGFGSGGSKRRKYASLFFYLMEKQISEAVVIGSVQSNNVMALSQLLIEKGIKPILFLLGDKPEQVQGNFLITSLLANSEQMHWIPRHKWQNVQHYANDYCQNLTSQGKKAIVIPEGASMTEALPGAITLPLDILQNEKKLKLSFDHVILEAGTGFTAIATLLTFLWLGKKSKIHILLLADDETVFKNKVAFYKNEFESLVKCELPSISDYTLYYPQNARSFGTINTQTLQHLKLFASNEGMITDPIYSTKLFAESLNHIQNQTLSGNILVIHSGCGFGLWGYQDKIKKNTNILF